MMRADQIADANGVRFLPGFRPRPALHHAPPVERIRRQRLALAALRGGLGVGMILGGLAAHLGL